MAVTVTAVETGSYGARAGVLAGDELLSVNGHEICDVLDYRFFIQAKKLSLTVRRGDETLTLHVRKGSELSDIGLDFGSYLMDRQQVCKNKCIFCFVDQMPCGLRDTLYVKDDDARMSFLFGSYITLTGLSEREVQRIIDLHIEPINVSVHTMNPALRVKMMGNPHAGESLALLGRFADAGVAMNTQLVLCPGINDGDELRFSLDELSKLAPAVKSVAAVPVGLTKYREGLPALRTYTGAEAAAVLDIIDEFNAHFAWYHGGEKLAYASDEFYLLAGRDLPAADAYGGFPQLENGVGLCALLKAEFIAALDEEPARDVHREISLATGEAARPLMDELVRAACDKFSGLCVHVYTVRNAFFGPTVTVAGLLTGADIASQLGGKPLGGELLIPRVSLRSEGDCFLDGMTVEELSATLGVPVTANRNDGQSFLAALLGQDASNL